MAARAFLIRTPGHLKILNLYAKDGDAKALAVVWSAEQRRARGGETAMDGKVFAYFSGGRKGRFAALIRINGDREIVPLASLRYNMALEWCEQNLGKTG